MVDLLAFHTSKGVTEVMAVALLISMTLAASGGFYAFQSGALSSIGDQDPVSPTQNIDVEHCSTIPDEDETRITIRNTDDAAVDTETVNLYVDAEAIDSYSVDKDRVDPQRTFEVTFGGVDSDESVRITTVSDQETMFCRTSDTHEQNGPYFNIQAVDLQATEAGEPVILDYNITNIGNQQATQQINSSINELFGSEIEQRSDTETIDPEESFNYTLEWSSSTEGEYEYTIETENESIRVEFEVDADTGDDPVTLSVLHESGGPENGSINTISTPEDPNVAADMSLFPFAPEICIGSRCPEFEGTDSAGYDSDEYVNESGDGMTGSLHVNTLEVEDGGNICVGSNCQDTINPSGPALGEGNQDTETGFLLQTDSINTLDTETDIRFD